jgi:NDP-sugar pyrophosphorylase family protein
MKAVILSAGQGKRLLPLTLCRITWIDEMARSIPVWTCSMKGLQWCEVDYHADLKQAEEVVKACGARAEVEADDRTCQTTEVTLR